MILFSLANFYTQFFELWIYYNFDFDEIDIWRWCGWTSLLKIECRLTMKKIALIVNVV